MAPKKNLRKKAPVIEVDDTDSGDHTSDQELDTDEDSAGSLVDFVVDDDENKIGKYETGAGLEIFSPKAISNPSNTIAVVLAWVQLQKIIESNSNFLDQGGKFLVLSPKPHVISKTGIVEFTEQ